MHMHRYFVEAGVIACRRVGKDDMRRIAKCTGGNIITSLADMEGDESFDPANLGSAGSVTEERVGDDDIIVINDSKESKVS